MNKTPNSEVKGYNNYGAHLREKYNGQRVYKVIVDGGFSCPNRDGNKGYGGCTYCNVDSFTPEISRTSLTMKSQLKDGMERAKNHYKADKFIVYFQPIISQNDRHINSTTIPNNISDFSAQPPSYSDI